MIDKFGIHSANSIILFPGSGLDVDIGRFKASLLRLLDSSPGDSLTWYLCGVGYAILFVMWFLF